MRKIKMIKGTDGGNKEEGESEGEKRNTERHDPGEEGGEMRAITKKKKQL